MTSMGILGQFSYHVAMKQFRKDRRQLIAKRRTELDHDLSSTKDDKGEESDDSVGSESVEEFDELSVESHHKDSEDDCVVDSTEKNVPNQESPQKQICNADESKQDILRTKNLDDEECKASNKGKETSQTSILHQENTRSLSIRLLDIDIGYSSDEGGYEDCTYFIDGIDYTFTAKADLSQTSFCMSKIPGDAEVMEEVQRLPAKKNDFDSLGQRAKLFAAIAFSDKVPDLEDFSDFPLPSKKQLMAMKNDELENTLTSDNRNDTSNDDRAHVQLSKTKIEQLSTSSNDVIRVWKSAEDAAATLQISLNDLKELLSGRYSEEIGDEVGGYRWRYAAEDAEVTKIPTALKESDKGKKAFLEFRDKLYDHEKPHSYKNGNRLRDYQIDGVNWLASCWYKNHSCILADEMGLGKTVQIVCYIEHLNRVEKIQRPFLVVVPLSTVEHWRREFEGWSDLKVCVYHDRQRVWRDVMREYEWYFADRPHTPDFLKFDVLVTTYDTLIGDFDVIGQIPWRVTVVDEAHRLRNQKGKLLECMKEISAKGTLQHGFQSRVLMTGTPLQNNIQELWTLLNFIEPFKFPSLEDFEQRYGNMGSREQVEKLQSKISPFMLRRVKEDVAKDIPAKEETVIDVELTSIQKQYYRAIFEHNHAFLNMGNSRNSAPKLMNIQMELRKCCNHPFLLDGVEQRETEKQRIELLRSGAFDNKSPEEIQQILNEQAYVAPSGKMVLLDKLLPKLREEGHKVLIFSQMVKMLDFLGEYCDFRKFKYERLGKCAVTANFCRIVPYELTQDFSRWKGSWK
jgi:chromodomain-helicase-DNA-binding protein 7